MALRIAPRALAVTAILGCATAVVTAADWPQWRGPDRTGVSGETGLLATWPTGGPRLVWRVADLGEGFGTPSVAGSHLYVHVNRGVAEEVLQARALADGRLVWELRLGKVGNPDQQPNYPGARSTPTVRGDTVYALGSDGDLVAIDRVRGVERWRRQLRVDFGGVPGDWAYAESPLVDGDTVVVSPGGRTTVVALDARSGRERWRASVPGNTLASYASAVVADFGGVRQYVHFLQRGVAGLEAASGRLLWRYDEPAGRSVANVATPIVRGADVFAASQLAGGGRVRVAGGADGMTATPAYFAQRLGIAEGGAVLVGAHIYHAADSGMRAIDWATGRLAWQQRTIGAASIAAADGKLYLHGENGEVALVDASPTAYQERGRFTPAGPPLRGSARAWAHPVVANGRLYLREANVLWAYDVAAPRAAR
jgi:outer membrane protein assembly factor BamB